jgi:hypothetical protein
MGELFDGPAADSVRLHRAGQARVAAMQVKLRHNPSFTIARCILAPGEPLRVEGGAMIAHSEGVQLESKAQGGVMKGLARSVLGGGSFFITTYTAPQQGGWVDVAGMLPGDTVPITITADRPVFLRRGSWIANSYGVEIDTQWGGMANLFGGEGGFGFRASSGSLRRYRDARRARASAASPVASSAEFSLAHPVALMMRGSREQLCC